LQPSFQFSGSYKLINDLNISECARIFQVSMPGNKKSPSVAERLWNGIGAFIYPRGWASGRAGSIYKNIGARLPAPGDKR
jgi:hypothetical protein